MLAVLRTAYRIQTLDFCTKHACNSTCLESIVVQAGTRAGLDKAACLDLAWDLQDFRESPLFQSWAVPQTTNSSLSYMEQSQASIETTSVYLERLVEPYPPSIHYKLPKQRVFSTLSPAMVLFVNTYLGFESLCFLSACSVLWQCSWFFRDNAQSHEESLAVLRSSTEFLRYAVSVALQKVQQLEETGQTDGPDGQNPDKMFQNLCKVTQWVAVARGDSSTEKQQCILRISDSQVGFWKKNAVCNYFKQLLLLGWDHCLSLLLRNQVEAVQLLCQSEWYSSNNGTWPGRTKHHQTLIFSLFVTFGSSLTVTEEVGLLQAGFLRPLGCNKVKIHF